MTFAKRRFKYFLREKMGLMPAATPGTTSSRKSELEKSITSQKVFMKSFCKSQFPHNSVNLSLIITNIKNNLTDWCGNRLSKNDFRNTFCEMKSGTPCEAALQLPGLVSDLVPGVVSDLVGLDSHSARPVRGIIPVIKWIRTSRLSIKHPFFQRQR